MARGWSPQRQATQAAAIQKWRPWERSTGPRTALGKSRSSRNADRGGQRQRFSQFVKLLNAGLRAASRGTLRARCQPSKLDLSRHLLSIVGFYPDRGRVCDRSSRLGDRRRRGSSRRRDLCCTSGSTRRAAIARFDDLPAETPFIGASPSCVEPSDLPARRLRVGGCWVRVLGQARR